MKKIKSIVTLVMLLLILPTTMAETSTGRVTRSMIGDYLRVGDADRNIIFTLEGDNPDTFKFLGVVETLPENVAIEVLTEHGDKQKIDPTHYSFTSIDSTGVKYKITSGTAIVGTYTISGTFVDSYKNTGTINSVNIRILPECTNDPICYYDTNGVPGLQRDEVINATVDYFNDTNFDPTLNEVLQVVRAYLGL